MDIFNVDFILKFFNDDFIFRFGITIPVRGGQSDFRPANRGAAFGCDSLRVADACHETRETNHEAKQYAGRDATGTKSLQRVSGYREFCGTGFSCPVMTAVYDHLVSEEEAGSG